MLSEQEHFGNDDNDVDSEIEDYDENDDDDECEDTDDEEDDVEETEDWVILKDSNVKSESLSSRKKFFSWNYI